VRLQRRQMFLLYTLPVEVLVVQELRLDEDGDGRKDGQRDGERQVDGHAVLPAVFENLKNQKLEFTLRDEELDQKLG
jgi:hypothetical protein